MCIVLMKTLLDLTPDELHLVSIKGFGMLNEVGWPIVAGVMTFVMSGTTL